MNNDHQSQEAMIATASKWVAYLVGYGGALFAWLGTPQGGIVVGALMGIATFIVSTIYRHREHKIKREIADAQIRRSDASIALQRAEFKAEHPEASAPMPLT